MVKAESEALGERENEMKLSGLGTSSNQEDVCS